MGAPTAERPGLFTIEYEVDPAVSTADVILPARLGGARTTVTLAGKIRMQFDTTRGTRSARYTSFSLTAPSRTLVARWQGREERVETGEVRIGFAAGDSLVGTIDPATRTYHLAGQITLETPALNKYGIPTIPLRTNVSGVLTDSMVYEQGASVAPLGIAGGMLALASRKGSETTPAPAPAPTTPCGVAITIGRTQVPVGVNEGYQADGTPAGGTYRWSITAGTGSASFLLGSSGLETFVKMETAGTVTVTVTYTCPDGRTATASRTVTIQ